MSLAAFAFTRRARPVVEIGTGESRAVLGGGQWDVSLWDNPGATWATDEPYWVDVTCDVRSARCEYGRSSNTDRYAPGVATLMVDNSSGWADSAPDDPPHPLQMRPGLEMRIGIEHVDYGLRWLFRGFIDAVNPNYDPTDPGTAQIDCIDALGEVNRAVFAPYPDPVSDGQSPAFRAHHILDRAGWFSSRRDIASAITPLIGIDYGGQAANLLGITADSVGGAVFAEHRYGRIVFRGAGWPTYDPTLPVDATIGNVDHGDPGYWTPEVEARDGWLDPVTGVVTTPWTPDMAVDGSFRLTARVIGPEPTQLGGAGGLAQLGAYYWARLYPSGNVWFQGVVASLNRAWRVPTGAAERLRLDMVQSSGTTWLATPYVDDGADGWVASAPPLTIAATSVAPSASLIVGSNVLGGASQTWHGRIYWAQCEAIERARLVFPGVPGNQATVSGTVAPSGDVEVVVRAAGPWVTVLPVEPLIAPVFLNPGLFLRRTGVVRGLQMYIRPNAANVTPTLPSTVNDGDMIWLRGRYNATTGVCTIEYAPDSPTEPTTWTLLGTGPPATPGPMAPSTVLLGVSDGAARVWNGRVARVIVRNGFAGPVLLDVSENNAGRMLTPSTFTATSGQTVTVQRTGRLVFPGAVQHWLTVANPIPATTTIEVTSRISVDEPWSIAGNRTIANVWPTAGRYLFLLRRNGALLNFAASVDGTTAPVNVFAVPPPVAPGVLCWLRARVNGDNGAGQTSWSIEWAPDAPTEPTSGWATLNSGTIPGTLTFPTRPDPVMIGQQQNSWNDPGAWLGRIARVILRTVWGGTPLLDVGDANTTTPGQSTFTATTGGTVTVTQSSAQVVQADPVGIVQPQPDRVVWRFDANDYPPTGGGTSYVDPRGRTWNLSALGAITPRIDYRPPEWIPPRAGDVCPVGWSRPFDRADIATRVIIGRDEKTAQVFDDLDGQHFYGIEPFSRTNLWTMSDPTIATLGQRILALRKAATAPRIRQVNLDARTAPNALDLMTTVDVTRPSRYRCRLDLRRGLVFDAEHFATAVRHEMTSDAWTCDLSLDLAVPFVTAPSGWDEARWDQRSWS